jgi:hypothetical protein
VATGKKPKTRCFNATCSVPVTDLKSVEASNRIAGGLMVGYLSPGSVGERIPGETLGSKLCIVSDAAN